MMRLGRAGLYYCMALFTMLGVLLMHEIPMLWHAKFYLDGDTLLATEPVLAPFAGSYSGTAWLFSPLFFLLDLAGMDLGSYATRFDATWFIANLLWALPFVAMVVTTSLAARLDCALSSVLVLFCALVLHAPFYGSINKDVIPAAICFAGGMLLIRGRTHLAVAMLVLLCVFYGVFVRSYFLLVAALFLAMQAVRARRWLLPAACVGVVLLYLAFPLIPRALIDIGRAGYLEGIAATRIVYWFDDHAAYGFVLNRVSALVRISFPVELLVGSPAYLPFVAFRCYASWLALRSLGPEVAARRRAAATMVVAFSIVQAVFEPDFGSAFRHFMATMPLLILLQAWRGLRQRRQPTSAAADASTAASTSSASERSFVAATSARLGAAGVGEICSSRTRTTFHAP